MVDLKGQYQAIKKDVDAAIQHVIDTTAFINGPDVKDFEKELAAYLDVKHVIACANGTDALQIALMALDIKPGDEVITSNFTFIATIEIIALLGAVPVLVDVNPNTFNIDTTQVAKAITPRTKAIIPVHLFGQCADMDSLVSLAHRHHIFVVEDTAQAIGATYISSSGQRRRAGTIGHIGCTSFFPSKNLGCYGDGGAMYTNDDSLAESLRIITNHGSKVKYHHLRLGVNSRLDTLQAAILRIKLRQLDNYCAARNKAAAYYDEQLKNIPQIQIPFRDKEHSDHVFHQYTLVVKDRHRDALKDYLQSKNIPSMIYYPVPFHLQEAFSYLPYKKGDFPVTEYLCEHVLSLPMHTELDEEQQQYVCNEIKKFFLKNE